MSSTRELEHVVALGLSRVADDDVVIAAEDEHGRRGVFVPAHLPVPTGDISDDALMRVLNQLESIRNYLAHRPVSTLPRESRAKVAAMVAATANFVVGATGQVIVPIAIIDDLIADADDLEVPQAAQSATRPASTQPVKLESPTGSVEYALPLALDDTYSSSDVSEHLSPTGTRHRTIARTRRENNELLGVKIGNQYRYPKFQLDNDRHEIRPAVAHANKALESSADPWGTLDWWFSPEVAFEGRRPVDLLTRGELTETLVDLAMSVGTASMD
jgi:hypothetical protein